MTQPPKRAERFPLQLPIRYRTVGATRWLDGTTENISRSGVLFRAAGTLDVDTTVEMRVPLPIAGVDQRLPEVLCRGRIVRTVPPGDVDARPGLAAAIGEYELTGKNASTSKK